MHAFSIVKRAAIWGGAITGLIVLSLSGLHWVSPWFASSTATKLASDGYVIGYYQGPGQNAPCTEENKQPHTRPC
jgi:hypothetical protein